MRYLTDIDSRENAETFVAYMLTLGVTTHVEQETGSVPTWSIWIKEEDKVGLAKSEWALFKSQPTDPKYTESVKVAKGILQQQRQEQIQREKNIRHVKSSGSTMGHLGSGKMPQVTFILIVTCVVFGFLTGFMNFDKNDKTAIWIVRTFKFVDLNVYAQSEDPLASIKRLEVWRLWTPALLHGGTIHLLVNMLTLASLGRLVERLEGRNRYIAILLITGVGAHLLQGLMPSTVLGLKALGGGPNFVGISGVTMGLFGFLAVKAKRRPELGLYIPPDAYFMVGFVIIIGFVGMTNFANLAHIGGLAVGAGLAFLWNR